MQEADACHQLGAVLKTLEQTPTNTEALQNAERELQRAIDSRNKLLSEEYQRISRLNNLIIEKVQHLLQNKSLGTTEEPLRGILDLSQVVNNILEMTHTKIESVNKDPSNSMVGK